MNSSESIKYSISNEAFFCLLQSEGNSAGLFDVVIKDKWKGHDGKTYFLTVELDEFGKEKDCEIMYQFNEDRRVLIKVYIDVRTGNYIELSEL